MTDSMQDDPEWGKVSDEDLIDLTDQYLNTSSPASKTNQIARTQLFMERSLHSLVKNICDIAMNSTNDRTRLAASIYLVDRVLGRIPTAADPKDKQGLRSPWEDVYEATVVQEPSGKELEK